MKLRKGFVSNSSTSSFICQICGGVEAERDCSPSELGMISFECGHVMHEDCLCNAKKTNSLIADFEEEEGGNREDSKYCPFCQLQLLSDDDFIFLAKLKNPKAIEQALEEIKSKFTTYDEFKKAKEI